MKSLSFYECPTTRNNKKSDRYSSSSHMIRSYETLLIQYFIRNYRNYCCHFFRKNCMKYSLAKYIYDDWYILVL